MLEVSKLIAQGAGLAPVLLKRAASVELDWDVRQKSRFDATDSAGRHLGIFLPRGTLVRGGDVLVAADGSLVRVIAARLSEQQLIDQPVACLRLVAHQAGLDRRLEPLGVGEAAHRQRGRGQPDQLEQARCGQGRQNLCASVHGCLGS